MWIYAESRLSAQGLVMGSLELLRAHCVLAKHVILDSAVARSVMFHGHRQSESKVTEHIHDGSLPLYEGLQIDDHICL